MMRLALRKLPVQGYFAGNLTLKADIDALLLELGVEPVRYNGSY
jgi:hypothetical protein